MKKLKGFKIQLEILFKIDVLGVLHINIQCLVH